MLEVIMLVLVSAVINTIFAPAMGRPAKNLEQGLARLDPVAHQLAARKDVPA